MRGPKDHYVRHVATAIGAGGAYRILYDASLNAYSVGIMRPVKIKVRYKDEWVEGKKLFTYHGTLDAMVALAQPEARGSDSDLPVLSATPSATPEERFQVDETFPEDAVFTADVSTLSMGIDRA